MAASNPPARPSAEGDETTDEAVGMAHLTVVPTNFDPSEADDGDD